jgi:hypothetical protein
VNGNPSEKVSLKTNACLNIWFVYFFILYTVFREISETEYSLHKRKETKLEGRNGRKEGRKEERQEDRKNKTKNVYRSVNVMYISSFIF